MHLSYVFVFAMQFIRVIPVHFNYVYVIARQFIRVIQCTLIMCMCLLCNLSE